MKDFESIKIGGVPEHFNLPWHLAIEDGAFEREGIKIEWEDQHGGTGEMTRSLDSGALDIAILLTEGITKSILQGLEAKILQVYVTTPLRWGIHVPYASNIKSFSDLEHKTFAISRYGSGSHLMTYVKADKAEWDLDQLNFHVVKNLEGGLTSLEQNVCQGFLWEKYTTHPYTVTERCRYIDEVVTPWPCFSIAASDRCLEEHADAIEKVLKIVNQYALQLKKNPKAIPLISNRYEIPKEKIESWFNATEWNYNGNIELKDFSTTIDYLNKLNLVSEEESDHWEEKLF